MMNKKIHLSFCASIFLISTILSVYMMTSASGIGEVTEPQYVEIADYYDNRKAVVTFTADDWYSATTSYFEDMNTMLVGKHIYYTGAVMTSLNPDWNQIQHWLDQGYLEVASHSRTHAQPPYDTYDSEIGGSKQDIISNLTLPAQFSFGGTEYIYSWIEPWGDSDGTVRQKLGEYKYLTDRRVNIDDNWATWDSANGLFDRIGYSIRMEDPANGGVDNPETLNSKFDIVYNAGGIYHLMTHPRNVNWEPGQYADIHTSYISNKNDVWYVNFGLLYLYHWIDTQNITQVTSTGSMQNKTFKINISSTDRQNYGAKYPITYVFDIPPSWINPYVNYRFRDTDPWTTMEVKSSSDFFNGINAVRFNFTDHKAYVSIGFDDGSNEIFLQILPQNNQPTADFTASPTSGNVPLDVSFTDTSTSYDEIVNWEWDFNNDAVVDSTEQNPTYRYDQPGLYTVSLTVYEADGDNATETKIDYINVNQPPVADADGPYTGTEGAPIAFDSSGSNDLDGVIASYFWDFGDGETSTEQNPTHTYMQNGIYTVTLTVTDDDSATDTDTTTAAVADTNPTADFSASPASGSEPLTVSLTDLSTSYDGITAWEWDFNNDGIVDSTEQNPTHVYNQDGVYTVTLTVYESDGDSATETKVDYITVNDADPTANFTGSPTSGPEPLTVSFTDTSTSHDGIISWNWSFGDGEISIEQNPIHIYASAGQYTVSLTVSEADGDNHTETKFPYIIVDDSVPTASFTYSPSNPLEGNLVTFDASDSTGYDSPLSYSWDFGDGAFGEGVSPTHAYAQDGDYLVTLTVTDADGSTDSTAQTITVADGDPVADFSATPTSGSEPLQVNFEDTSTSYDGIVTWAWEFGDGETSTEQNPTHIYVAEGTYTVSLTVFEGDGDTATETKLDFIIVSDAGPSANFSASPTSGSEPLTVSFTDESTSHDGITAWEWDFNNDGIVDSTEQNPTHVYNQDGVYTVTLKVYENDGNSDTETKVDYVTVTDTVPIADFNATTTSGVEPFQASFTDLSVSHDGIVSWSWDFGDGETSTEQNPTHTYAQNGTYTVALTVHEGDGDSATETKADYIIVFDAEPIADFMASLTSGSEPLTVGFTDLSVSHDGIVSWSWDFGDGEASVEQNPIHTYTSAGQYTVSLTVSEADGDNATETKSSYIIVEDSVPTASFTYLPSSPLEGNLVTFDASGSTGYDEPLSYSWDFGDGAFGEGVSPTHAYAQDGDYLVTLTVTDADGSTDSTSQTITVADGDPVADFSATPTSGSEPLQVNFTDLSTSFDGITSWTWNFGDGATSIEQNPIHVYAVDGTYTISLTVLEGDGSSDVKTKMHYITVMDTAPTADFSYSPNPEALTIDFTDQSTSYDELVSWTWDFGHEETSAEQNPTHKFPDDGIFNVTFTVTDSDGSVDTITKQVSVLNIAPTADFNIVSSPKPTIDEDITFLDQSSDPNGYIVSWFWDLGDGTNSTSQNVTHRYYTIGTFIVNLTVTDDDGETGTISKSITIYDVVPPVTVDDYDGLWHTSDFTINLTATDDLSGVQTTYYQVNDGPILNVQVDGQPLISVEGYNKLEYWSVDVAGNEETHQTIPDVKLDKTNPTANAGPDQAVEEDTLMTFDGSASFDNINITSYRWTFYDGASQTLTGMKPTYTFNTPGDYAVILSVIDAALNSATDTVVITVIDITKPIANAGDDQVVHEEVTVTFDGSASTDNVEIVSYVWTFTDITPQTLHGVNSTHIFDIPGIYNVTLTVSDAHGNLATDVVTITVIDATWPAANAGPDQVVDEDTLVNFDGSASTDNVGIISYIWTFTDGTLQTRFGVNSNYTFETPGVYIVTLNVSDAEGYYTTDTVTITVLDITPPIVDAGNYTTVVENAPVNFDASGSSDNVAIVNYIWDFGDGTVENSTIPSVIHKYTNPRVYTLMLTIMDEAGNMNASTISVVVNRDTDGDLIPDFRDTDDDNDEIPDDWEIFHGLNHLDHSDASLDFDGDGLSNLTEYQIDSDPNAYTSPSPFPLVGVLVIVIIGFVIFLGVLFMRKL